MKCTAATQLTQSPSAVSSDCSLLPMLAVPAAAIKDFQQLLLEPRHDKTNKVTVCPAKTQISLGIRPVWSESLLSAQWVAKNPSFLHAESEDSGQTGRMPRLIWVLAGRTVIWLVLSCRGSLILLLTLPQNYQKWIQTTNWRNIMGPQLSLSALRRLWSDWADAQADLSLRWAHRSFCWFCPEAAQLIEVS